MIKSRLLLVGILASSIFITSCASIVSGQNQGISIKTIDTDGKNVSDAVCELTNDDGTWFVTTPGSVSVDRSSEDLQIICKKDGMESGVLSSKSKAKGMAFGNILFGGIIGAGVDTATGAAFDYPVLITVKMGEKNK